MMTSITGVWIDVTAKPPGKFMTMRATSPLYDPDVWLRGDGKFQCCVNPYNSGDYDELQKLVRKETGLDVLEHDSHDGFSFFVDVSKSPTWANVRKAQRKLKAFVEKHFEAVTTYE